MTITRRGFLAGILAAGVAPAAVGSGVLMPVKTIARVDPFGVYGTITFRRPMPYGVGEHAADAVRYMVEGTAPPLYQGEISHIEEFRFVTTRDVVVVPRPTLEQLRRIVAKMKLQRVPHDYLAFEHPSWLQDLKG